MSFRALSAVLVPIDLADPDAEAVRAALEFAAGPDRVHVLAVVDSREISPMAPDPSIHAAEARSALRAWLSAEGFTLDLRTHVTTATSASVAICELAGAVRADLVVIASHGRRGVPRLVLGSVAEQVVRASPCPVLVLRHAG